MCIACRCALPACRSYRRVLCVSPPEPSEFPTRSHPVTPQSAPPGPPPGRAGVARERVRCAPPPPSSPQRVPRVSVRRRIGVLEAAVVRAAHPVAPGHLLRSLSLSLSLSINQSITLSLTLSHTHTYTHSLSVCMHVCVYTHTHTYAPTRALLLSPSPSVYYTHTHTHTHTCPDDSSPPWAPPGHTGEDGEGLGGRSCAHRRGPRHGRGRRAKIWARAYQDVGEGVGRVGRGRRACVGPRHSLRYDRRACVGCRA